jgi:hypothetical protein
VPLFNGHGPTVDRGQMGWGAMHESRTGMVADVTGKPDEAPDEKVMYG